MPPGHYHGVLEQATEPLTAQGAVLFSIYYCMCIGNVCTCVLIKYAFITFLEHSN